MIYSFRNTWNRNQNCFSFFGSAKSFYLICTHSNFQNPKLKWEGTEFILEFNPYHIPFLFVCPGWNQKGILVPSIHSKNAIQFSGMGWKFGSPLISFRYMNCWDPDQILFPIPIPKSLEDPTKMSIKYLANPYLPNQTKPTPFPTQTIHTSS